MSDATPTPSIVVPVPQSKWFKVSEWSSKHPLAKPYPVEWIETRWRALANTLDIIRDEVKAPIIVTPNGGYRCEEHNRAVGGKPGSQHLDGRAADVKCHALTPTELHSRIFRLWQVGQLPLLGGLGVYDWGVHVDVRNAGGKLARWDERGALKQQVA